MVLKVVVILILVHGIVCPPLKVKKEEKEKENGEKPKEDEIPFDQVKFLVLLLSQQYMYIVVWP